MCESTVGTITERRKEGKKEDTKKEVNFRMKGGRKEGSGKMDKKKKGMIEGRKEEDGRNKGRWNGGVCVSNNKCGDCVSEQQQVESLDVRPFC